LHPDVGAVRTLHASHLHKAPPARPRKPPFSWKQLGTYLLSERTLNGLLGLGAFLVLAAALVISTANPTGLAPVAHLGMMVATTLVLFAAGILLQRKLHLPRTGLALLALGTAFIPIDSWALGRDVLQLDGSSIWLLTSLLCLPIYAGCYAWLFGRPFAVLTAVSGGSLLLSCLSTAGVPPAWCVAALGPLALAYMAAAQRLRHDWDSLAWALSWTAQITMPVIMLMLLAAQALPDAVLAGLPDAWRTALLLQRTAGLAYTTGCTWWLGAAFAILASRMLHARFYAIAAAWLVPCSFLLTLTRAPWSSAWYGLCLALLAGVYLLLGRFVLALPARADGSYAYGTVAREPIFQVAGCLALAALAWPIQQFESQILTLVALTALFGVAATLLHQRAWAYVATFLVVTIQIRQVTVPHRYLAAAQALGLDRISAGLGFALLAAVLLALAERAVRASGESRRPVLETLLGLGAWRSLFAAPFFAAGLLSTLLAIGFGCSGGAIPVPGASDSAALFLVVGLYTALSMTRRSSALLYPATWLVLLPLTALVSRIGHHPIAGALDPWLAVLLAAVGLAYLAMGRSLDRCKGTYNVPLYLSGYLLGVLAVLCAIPQRGLDVALLGLLIGTYAWSAREVHVGRHPAYQVALEWLPDGPAFAVADMLFQYLACWLFPCWLLLAQSLRQSAATPAAYAVTLALLAPCYVLAGSLIQRVDRTYRWPWYIAGYALAAVAPLAAAADSTLRVLTLAISIALCLASAVHSRHVAWFWLVAGLLPVLLCEVLLLSGRQVAPYAFGLLGLSLIYDLLGLMLHHRALSRSLDRLALPPAPMAAPFLLGGQVLAGLGLLGVLDTSSAAPICAAYLLGSIHYALSFKVGRGAWSWPLAIALAVCYGALVAAVPLFHAHAGLALLPGIAAYLVGVQALRRRQARSATIQERPARARAQATGTLIESLGGWSTPFSLIGHSGALLAFASAFAEPSRVAAIAIVCTLPVLYGLCTWLSRAPAWLYPCLGAALAAYWSILYWLVPGLTLSGAALAGIAPVWLLLALAHGYSIDRLQGERGASSPFPWDTGWARPFALAGMLVLVATTGAGLDANVPSAGLVLALAYALPLSLLATYWQRHALVWLSLAFIGLAYQEALRVAGAPLGAQPPSWAALALLAGGVATVLHEQAGVVARQWSGPLAHTAVALGGLAVAASYATVVDGQTTLQSLALSLCVSGVAFLQQGMGARQHRLQRTGMGLLAAAYLTELFCLGVTQPAAFLYPAGCALLVLTYAEERRHTDGSLKHTFEVGALALVAGTALLQALGQLGATGSHLAYVTVLLLIALALLCIGAALRWTRTFFVAGAALVLAVLILVAEPLQSLNIVYLVLLIGCAMIGLVVFLEQRRQQIPLWLDEVRLRLEAWS
jgi:hypothetical protein